MSRDQAQTGSLDPADWRLAAEKIHRVALLIADRVEADFEKAVAIPTQRFIDEEELLFLNVGHIFWLNAGFAIEDLLKGLAIKKNPKLIENNVLDKSIKTHKLLKLCRIVQFPISNIEAFYLTCATEYITWAGRYPAPIGSNAFNPLAFSMADISVYKDLYGRLIIESDANGIFKRKIHFENLNPNCGNQSRQSSSNDPST